MDEKGKPRERPIRRREFVNGLAAISATAALAPAGRLAATEKAPAPGAPVSPSPRAYSPAYPPGLTGLRGNHVGSFEVAHDLALGGGKWPPPKGLLDAPYDLIVVDEAAQSTEPELLVPIRASHAATRLFLFGDHQQLRPDLHSNVADFAGLCTSLFQRMYLTPGIPHTLLDVQYRMHPTIAQWPSHVFFSGRLTDDASVQNLHRVPQSHTRCRQD